MIGDFDFSNDAALGVPNEFGIRPLVWRFTPDTVVKTQFPDSEPYIMEIVSSQTTIRTPKMRRCIYSETRGQHLFVEYIDGVDLETAWPSLSLWRKLSIAWTIRGYVRQLRRVQLPRSDVPGPMDGYGDPMPCFGRCFTENGAGPFSSYDEMSAWFRRKLRIALSADDPQNPPTPQKMAQWPFDDTMPLVLIHGDISMRNVRLDKDGNVWLIDWGFSGAYPQWFEYSGMMAYDDGRGTPRLWLWLAQFMAGRYQKQYAFFRKIEWTLVMYHTELPAHWPDA